ncbi:MAG: serine/threonine protein kinase, partial [Candidatus Obscuribacterales bacterium]|nr:serine/threonine protein kinase [Candidatus Obscuribacterales bacterium]
MPVNDDQPFNVCAICGKVVRQIRSGSLTGWIFGGTTCECSLRSRLTRLKGLEKFVEPAEIEIDGNALPSISERYRLDSLIAKGGMGFVYSALDIHLDKPCVVKLMRTDLITQETSLQRFGHETSICANFDHPNLVSVTDYDVSPDGVPFLVMDRAEGSTLRDMLENGVLLSEAEVISVTVQLCNAIDYVHQRGLIHRDIKPENILLKKDHLDNVIVKLIDFGIAKVESQEGEIQRFTQTGEVFGSPHYMSPEQCLGQAIDKRTDIYLLGCVLYEVLVGRPPFRGSSLLDTLNRHVSESIVRPGELRKGVNDRLESIVIKCLEKKPDDRFQSTEAIKVELISAQKHIRHKTGLLTQTIRIGSIVILTVVATALAYPKLFPPDLNNAPQNLSTDWNETRESSTSYSRSLTALAFSHFLATQQLWGEARNLLDQGIKSGSQENAPTEILLFFTAAHFDLMDDTWPDLDKRKDDLAYCKRIMALLQKPISLILKSDKSNDQQAALRNLLAINFYHLSRIANHAQSFKEGSKFLQMSEELCSNEHYMTWLRIKLDVYGADGMADQAAYMRLKRAY